MTTRYFDVIVLGRSIGALSAAALLARRDFRVLVLGQGTSPCDYAFEGHTFRRRAFTMLASSTPPWKRVLHELAQTQNFRRRLTAMDPMFTVVLPEQRLELPPDIELFEREIDREFPEVRQVVDELYGNLATTNALVDGVFERDLVWPPATLWERFETGRAAQALPFTGKQGTVDLLARFPLGHTYRPIVHLSTEFASHLAAHPDPLPPLSVARLHGAWTRGLLSLERGEDELTEFLVERIEAHGGTCRLASRAINIALTRGKISGVLEDGDEHPIGTGCVITDLNGEQLASLSAGEGILPSARRAWPKITAGVGRYVASLILRAEGLPDSLPAETFIAPTLPGQYNPRRPIIHLQRVSNIAGPKDAHCNLLVAELLLPARGPLTLLEAREAVISTLHSCLPFFEQHLVAVDSAHDGLPLWIWEDGKRRDVDRIHVRETLPLGEPMAQQWVLEPRGYLEISGEPVRGPIPGSYLVGSSVLPALGQEGEIIAALSAVHLVTRKHGGHQRIRQKMWSRIETS
ncbi:MAG: NAD(P)-binding protein [Myxococcales bacterium]